jgi:hypothetical protein
LLPGFSGGPPAFWLLVEARTTDRNGAAVKLRYFYPLVGFVVPTLVIAYGFLIPKSCIAGVNNLTIGFAGSVVGASLTYWMGLRSVLRDQENRRQDPPRSPAGNSERDESLDTLD